VNLPAEATVDDVADVYFQGWKLGLKALAIYRNNSKVGQPLSSKKDSEKVEAADVVVATRPTRKRLPKKRRSQTVSFAVAGAEGYMTAGEYDDGTLGEVFIKMSKQGSTLAGVMDAFSVSISIGLQYGVPLEAFVSKYINMRFDPAGMTDDADIRIAQSVMDYLFRRLALDYLPMEKRADLGIFSAEERAASVASGSYGAADSAEVDVEGLAQSVPVASAPAAAGGGQAGAGRGGVVHRAARGDAGDRGGCAAVHDVWHEDAAGWVLLRVRGVREHERLYLPCAACRATWQRAPDVTGTLAAGGNLTASVALPVGNRSGLPQHQALAQTFGFAGIRAGQVRRAYGDARALRPVRDRPGDVPGGRCGSTRCSRPGNRTRSRC
jgi:hypothetical protein